MSSLGKYIAQNRYYLTNQKLHVVEDLTNEFKGHRSLTLHDIPKGCMNDYISPPSRSSISTAICGMLNNGIGGMVYVGVSDEGVVKSISMTKYQCQHFICNFKWMLDHFNPPVSYDRCNVLFVPVLTNSKLVGTQNEHDVQFGEMKSDPVREIHPHRVAYSQYCWCDFDAKARRGLGILPRMFVIEVQVMPWNAHVFKVDGCSRDNTLPPLPPIYVNEVGRCFYRHHSRQIKMTLDYIRRLLVHRVQEHYSLKATVLQSQATMLLKLKQEMTSQTEPMMM